MTFVGLHKYILLIALSLSLEALAQQIACVNSIEEYSVDIEENNGAGSTGSTYTWSVENPEFSGEIIIGATPNKIKVNWGNTPNGIYTLKVVEDNGFGCPVSRFLDVEIIGGAPLDMGDFYLCKGEEIQIDGPQGWENYDWTHPLGLDFGNTSSITVDQEGNYLLEVTSGKCSYTASFEVLLVNPPDIVIQTVKEDQIIVQASGGKPPYLYQLELATGEVVYPYQHSNVFKNLEPNYYVVSVMSEDGYCISVEVIYLLPLTNIITPNGDNINDKWHLKALRNFPDAYVEIYDRYGKFVALLNNENDFCWDGKYNGLPVPSTSYWFKIFLPDGSLKTGWVVVKNRDTER